MASFVPPQFSNLGKSTADLLKKKFEQETKYTVQTKNKTASGLLFTTGGDVDAKSKDLTGSLKLNYKGESFGESEASISTAGPAKAELKLKKLAKGLTVTITADSNSKGFGKATAPTLKAGAEYAQEFYALSASAETKYWSPALFAGSAVIGYDGLSVGGELKFNTDKTSELADYNVGFEYALADHTITAKTSDKGANLGLSYFQKVDKDLQVGASFTLPIDGASTARTLTLASEYKIDASTSIKAKASTDKVASVAVEHRLANPRVQIGVASSWDIPTFTAWNPKAFGFSFTFGDYDA